MQPTCNHAVDTACHLTASPAATLAADLNPGSPTFRINTSARVLADSNGIAIDEISTLFNADGRICVGAVSSGSSPRQCLAPHFGRSAEQARLVGVQTSRASRSTDVRLQYPHFLLRRIAADKRASNSLVATGVRERPAGTHRAVLRCLRPGAHGGNDTRTVRMTSHFLRRRSPEQSGSDSGAPDGSVALPCEVSASRSRSAHAIMYTVRKRPTDLQSEVLTR